MRKGQKTSEETKRKISEYKRLHPESTWLGKKHSEETKDKMRKSAEKADLVGQRFGRLVVLCLEKVSDRNYTVWKCRCDCGNELSVSIGSLISNNTRSCGCLKAETSKISGKKNTIGFGKAAENRLVYMYKRGAKRRNLSWEILKEDFLCLTKKNCYYCGESPSMVMGKHSHLNGNIIYNGVDRLNNKIGYTKENCVPCCNLCNITKRSTDYTEFIQLIRKIYKNLHLE